MQVRKFPREDGCGTRTLAKLILLASIHAAELRETLSNVPNVLQTPMGRTGETPVDFVRSVSGDRLGHKVLRYHDLRRRPSTYAI